MPNYGDVALNQSIGPDWDRSQLHDQNFALMTVGHQDGVSDVYLESDPEARHQFAWCDLLYRQEFDVNRTRGYRLVNKNDGWVKNPNLWEWDATGNCVCFGQALMARPAELYFRDLKLREEQRKSRKDKEADAALAIAEAAGIQAEIGEKSTRRRAAR